MPSLFDKRLIIVTGKGGVGKSSVCAALALIASSQGKRTLVCELNTQERITALLGKPPAGADISPVEDNLWAVDIRPPEAMREYVLMVLKFESLYKAVFENRMVRYFLRFIPSLQELVMLGKVLYHLREKLPDGSFRYENILLDAPATGHALSLLTVPRVLLDTVPPGPLAKEAAIMRDLLEDRKTTGLLLVAIPEEMPVNETLELQQALSQRAKLQADAVILNEFVPDRFSEGDEAELAQGQASLVSLARGHRARAAHSKQYKEKLEKETGVPVVALPRLYSKEFGRACIELLAQRLSDSVLTRSAP